MTEEERLLLNTFRREILEIRDALETINSVILLMNPVADEAIEHYLERLKQQLKEMDVPF